MKRAIYDFQECVAKYNSVGFGGGNPDLGGIGAFVSMTILCIAGTVGCWTVLVISFILNHRRYKIHLKKVTRAGY
ncbi:Protein of unknown function [Pyronema omphalodes CBS 100304]|uniref:Uncharacterized protein n=1 Tax=Pyronema omphalodes (strain CBS 100304) TaxID=1076935 RepID=U4L288_PYROM|nr:Protein of unknown function [Pyronema omphalodes CBS 100304]